MKLPELKKKLQNRYAVRVVAGVLSIVLLGGSLGTYTVLVCMVYVLHWRGQTLLCLSTAQLWHRNSTEVL